MGIVRRFLLSTDGRSTSAAALVIAAILATTAPPARAAESSDLEVSIRKATGTARMVRVPRGEELSTTLRAASSAQRARTFLQENKDLFGIAEVDRELRLDDQRKDLIGGERIDYRQVHEGIEVFGGSLRAHFDPEQRLYMVNGVFVPIGRALKTEASLDAAFAEDAARTLVAGQRVIAPQTLEAQSRGLKLFPAGLLSGQTGSIHLVYEVEVFDPAGSVREFAYIDAHDGQLREQITGIYETIQRKVSEGSLSNVIWSEGDTDPIPSGWAGGSSAQVAAWQDEIDGALEIYNFMASMTNGVYLSYDGADAPMLTVNNDPGISCPNATWNGTSTNYCDGVTPDDVVAHEWGHGLTQSNSNLIYQWHSGAINEAYSDIWGESTDLLNGRGTDSPSGARASDGSLCSNFGSGSPSGDATYRWLMGEDSTAFGGAIRDMWRPECHNDPGRVGSSSYWCSTGDNGGVHINSGVPNRGFALLVDGGTYNGRTVSGIGIDKAGRIYWRAQTQYLVPASDFHDLANALEAACSDLVGTTPYQLVTTGSATWGTTGPAITATDCTQVDEMIAATELRSDVPCSFSTILDPNAPALCPSANLSDLHLQDFESGLGSWTAATRDVANASTFDTPHWSAVTSLPGGRSGFAAFVPNLVIGNCQSDTEAGVLYLQSPNISIPSGVTTPLLAFDHWVSTESEWDGANVKASVNGGPWVLVGASAFSFNAYNDTLNASDNPLGGEAAFTGTDGGSNSGSWGQSQVSLAAVASAGDTIQLRFELGIDGCNGSVGWYVDDVQVYQCTSGATPTPGPSSTPTPDPGNTPTPNPGNTPTPTPTPDPGNTPTPTPDGLCREPVAAIPDGASALTDTLVVSSAIAISDLNVSLEIDHTWVGDITVALENQDTGTRVTLIERPGVNSGSIYGCSSDDIDAVLDDEATGPVGDECETTGTAIAGTFVPQSPLSAFDGEALAGSWILTVTDSVLADTGTLQRWCLAASGNPSTPTPTPSPTPTPTPIPSTTPTPVPTPVPSPTPTPTPVPTPVPTPTPTAVPTPIPTPTPTAVPTPIPTQTPVPTPTSTPIAPAVCGNSVIEIGEQCDDGAENGGNASCCSASCNYKPDGAASCDANLCTPNDVCNAGVCSSGACAIGNSCNFCGGLCAETSGSCACGL